MSIQELAGSKMLLKYHLNEQLIPKLKSHDVGVILFDNLSWRNHYT